MLHVPQGNTPLHAAVEAGNLEVLRLLLGLGPEVNVQVGDVR